MASTRQWSNIHTIKPLDKEAVIRYAQNTGHIITVEDHNIIGGLGTAVAEVLAEEGTGKLTRHGTYRCIRRIGYLS